MTTPIMALKGGGKLSQSEIDACAKRIDATKVIPSERYDKLSRTERAYLYQARAKLRDEGKWPVKKRGRGGRGRGGGRGDGNDRDVRQRIAALEARLPPASVPDDASTVTDGQGDDAASAVPSNRTHPALRQNARKGPP